MNKRIEITVFDDLSIRHHNNPVELFPLPGDGHTDTNGCDLIPVVFNINQLQRNT